MTLDALRSEFPEWQMIFGTEGGVVYAATGPEGYALVTDEAAMVAMLDEDDPDRRYAELPGVHRFDTAEERLAYAEQRGWLNPLPTEMWDELCARSVAGAAKMLEQPTGEFPLERKVEEAFVRALSEQLRFHEARSQEKIELHTWDQQPGNFDVVALRLGRAEAAFELKIDAVGQCLYDLYKVLALEPEAAGYLVAAATPKRFDQQREGCGFFSREPGGWRQWRTVELLHESPAWRELMENSSGKPATLPTVVETRCIAAEQFANAPSFELRACAVRPASADRVQCDAGGFLL